MATKKKTKIQKKSAVGIGVVMTWRNSGKPLGGALPKYMCFLNGSKKNAVDVASKTRRFQDFCNDPGVEFWLCGITLKPIKQVDIPHVDDPF